MKSYKSFISEQAEILQKDDECIIEDTLEAAEADCEYLLERVRRIIRVRGGKIKRGKTAGRKGYALVKGKIRRIPAAVLRRKKMKLRRAARKRRGKQASINRKTARSRRIGKRIKRRRF
jgi:hypothetical protein